MKTIRSRDNDYAKHLIALAHSSRERKKSGHTILDGAHLVEAYIAAGGTPLSIAIRESALHGADASAIISRVSTATDIHLLADALMDEASSLESAASIMALINTPISSAIPANADCVVALDGVQDPGNVGSILRSAAAMGVQHALLGKGTAFAWSPKVIRAGQGAHFVLNIVEGLDLLDWMTNFNGQTLALVPSQTQTQTHALHTLDLKRATALLIGSEGAGLSSAVINRASVLANIPMRGKIESLNAAACAAMALYEMQRQRLQANTVSSNVNSNVGPKIRNSAK